MLPDIENLISELQASVKGDAFWEDYLAQLTSERPAPFSIHLAVMVEPYLSYVLQGRKSVESRFSMRRSTPYGRVKTGDVILLKHSGGPIVGVCYVTDTWFYELDPQSWTEVREVFTEALCAQDPSFWQDRQSASFASLMRVQRVRPLKPIKYSKQDRRGWVVLQASG